MRLLAVVREECVVTGLTPGSKEEALEEVVRVAKTCSMLAEVDDRRLFQAFKQREDLGSTGFGNSIAIPHCRLAEVKEFVVGIVTVPGGVEFDSTDKEQVRLIVFIVGPERESNEHVALLSEISHALRIPGATDEMISCTTTEALRESFLRYSRDNVDTKDHANRNLFHVLIVGEDKFREVLQIFAAMEATAISVVEAKMASEYLTKLPLFTGFWSDRTEGVCHTITAMVEKKFTNEIIRRIEHVAGKLDQSSDVAVAVQDVFYAAGVVRV